MHCCTVLSDKGGQGNVFQGIPPFTGAESTKPILEKRKDITLHHHKGPAIQVIGCKASCGSVWCKSCFVRKGGAKRFADRLILLDWRAGRQVVLTVDPKKFGGSGQAAYEAIKESGGIHQFIHNLERTFGVKIKYYVWVLEWHSDGFPHWHVFIQTQKGKKGQIGNKALLKCWKHGLVREDYIKSEKHWRRFTSYFGRNGYFDPRSGVEKGKDKTHQFELPEWAKQVTYRIRKMGSSRVKKDAPDSPAEEQLLAEEGCIDEHDKEEKQPRTYQEILSSCGQSTLCHVIRQDHNYAIWVKLPIPYRDFKEYPGKYIEGAGYCIPMNLDGFFLFLELNGYDVQRLEIEAQKEVAAC